MKRLLEEGSEFDRMLLSAGLEEAPPARSVERTLASLGIGGVAVVSSTAVGAAVGEATLSTATVATSNGVAMSLVAKVACGLALGGAALGGGYWMGAHEADERARLELQAATTSERAAEPVADRVRLPHEGTGEVAPPAAAEPHAESQAQAKRSVAVPVSSALGAEVALLDQANAALQAGDVEACLARLRAYASRYPDGQLKAEAAELHARALAAKR